MRELVAEGRRVSFVKLISLQEILLDIDFVQLDIICDGERHHEASYSKTWRRREIIDIIYTLVHRAGRDHPIPIFASSPQRERGVARRMRHV